MPNAVTTVNTKTLFFTMVMHPVKGWCRVGNAYPSKQAARDWLPFVRGVWRGLRVKIAQSTVELHDGHVSEKSKKVLDEKFNLDV